MDAGRGPGAADPQVERPALLHPSPTIDAAGATHIGLRRPTNEDAFIFGRVGRFLAVDGTSLQPDSLDRRIEQAGWYAIVADGMGGHSAGEVASRAALLAAFEATLRRSQWVNRVASSEVPEVLRRMQELIEQVHDSVSRLARAAPDLAGMGTTFTLARVAGSSLIVGHVGDSRVYLVRRGKLRQITKDQTMAQLMADLGEIRPQEVARHYMSHLLTQSVGSGGPIEVDARHVWLLEGDALLMATDGLTGVVDEPEIERAIERGGAPAEIVERLIRLALEHGGPDNVTAVFARVASLPEAASAGPPTIDQAAPLPPPPPTQPTRRLGPFRRKSSS
jgi:protein phosphatase